MAQVILSLSLILGVFTYYIYLPDPMTLTHKTQWQVKVLGYSVWQIFINEIKTPIINEEDEKIRERSQAFKNDESEPGNSRDIASIMDQKGEVYFGKISRDFWGHPFSFKINKKTESLYLWSSGPDGKNESIKILDTTFKGDDIGVVLDLKTQIRQ